MKNDLKVIPYSECHFVKKGWGYEKWLVNNDKFCGKILGFNEGRRLSWHKHKIKSEHFFVWDGKVILKYGWNKDINKATEIILNAGDGFFIPVGLCHQVIALQESRIIEFSTHHEDSDSIRIIKGD